VAPSANLDDPSWQALEPWEDPLAPPGRCASGKRRIETPFGPAIEIERQEHGDGRALVTGEPLWQDYCVECRVQPIQVGAEPCYDNWASMAATAGAVVRMETLRKYYYFCIEDARRLVLYRRIDQDWHVMQWTHVTMPAGPVTLRLEVSGNRLEASCPELGVTFRAVDSTIAAGRAGFRALGECRLFDLRLTMTPEQEEKNRKLVEQERARIERRGSRLPDAVPAGELDLSGGRRLLVCSSFAGNGHNDLLWRTPEGLVATTWTGEALWRFDEPKVSDPQLSPPDANGARRIYLMAGERLNDMAPDPWGGTSRRLVHDEIVVLDAGSGGVLARTSLPDEGQVQYIRRFDFSYEVGCSSRGCSVDFVVRTWQTGGGSGEHLWAYDRDLQVLWHRMVEPPYGHHNAVHLADLNRDGEIEILAGGTCLTTAGEVVWVHDLADEMRRFHQAHHYDAVLIEPPENAAGTRPTAFLIASSAGLYVVDASNGETRHIHRMGHAQGGSWCRVRDDLPGRQALVHTRWGNYGIVSLFSPEGERLWTLQTDYAAGGIKGPVQWAPDGPQHLWLSTNKRETGLYDGHGRCVKILKAVCDIFKDRRQADCRTRVLRQEPDGPDLLAVQVEDKMLLFAPGR